MRLSRSRQISWPRESPLLESNTAPQSGLTSSQTVEALTARGPRGFGRAATGASDHRTRKTGSHQPFLVYFRVMDLLDALRRPEGKTLEFKRDLSSPDGLLRTV